MARRVMIKGNEAIAMGAIEAGCRYYFGYPITPQTDIPEYLSAAMPKVGGVFLQAESEVAAINMLLGAAATGARAMTSSSSPGISLKQEGISYLAGSQIPGVIVNMSRSGPGLGGIHPSQGDYFQSTRGGGHGDYRTLVLAPSTAQENYDLTMLAFDLADKYRNPVMVLGDALIGQIKEPVELKSYRKKPKDKPWALTGAKGRHGHILKSLFLADGELTDHNWMLAKKYKSMEKEVRFETYRADDAELLLVAFGSVGRILRTSVDILRDKGKAVGLLRPITLFPFPNKAVRQAADKAKVLMVMEMSTGQMVEDVRLAAECACPVDFYGRPPGSIPTPDELAKEAMKIWRKRGLK
ncbi:MAG: 3-methyl-2-oxobutanoate dehydrogenase subunit VorB [Desulfarculus sp.]|nr:3-methyl-2-oxobutanoate dehydrogenase subunit VorB [Pseudomonadota bacterium]MBV1714686.1 3-methyl-2-oxobutanoate dehydrogenase subunit VorB [Desulfarculus sp.]MBU4577039.1 3-methyl-2-oxobutanoate dehydrogenase subunit VorB [Pseudomonadota bacterium]MBU4600022.1 3-methyl-2-oxobutanoate dehydrogenase subunit VorB [Pseudomonadota bacterium]MBV1740223.1 3-methyl-2-oxobutanoate dehydrogenase subunit VorB [Desulfarculus sp.]